MSDEVTTADYNQITARLDVGGKAGERVVIRREHPAPISVSERLPDDGSRMLAYFPDINSIGVDDGFWITATWSRGRWFDGGLDEEGDETFFDSCEISHWLPLPPKP